MKKIDFKVISKKEKAQEIFEKFAIKQRPYDEWDFRASFNSPNDFPLYFLAGYVDNNPIGVLPLQENLEKNCLEFFGGSFMEYNGTYLDYNHKNRALDFYQECLSIRKNLLLRDLIDGSPTIDEYEQYDTTYTIDLKKFKHLESYLGQKFSSKSRASLKKKIKKIEENKIEILENNFDDIDLMIDLNRKRFGTESSFEDIHQRETFHLLMKLPWRWKMQTFVINNQKEAVSLSLQYKKTFMYIMAGSNIEKVPNIGTYVVIKALEKSFELGMETFDAGRNPSGWKDRWHMDPTPVYRLIKNCS